MDGSEVVEFFTSDTPTETTVNFATDAPKLIVLNGHYLDANIKAAVRQRDLYADCFNMEHVKVFEYLLQEAI